MGSMAIAAQKVHCPDLYISAPDVSVEYPVLFKKHVIIHLQENSLLLQVLKAFCFRQAFIALKMSQHDSVPC